MKLQLDAAAQQFGNRVAQTYANEKGDTVMAFLRDVVGNQIIANRSQEKCVK